MLPQLNNLNVIKFELQICARQYKMQWVLWSSKLKCRCVPQQAINACGGVQVEGNALLTLAVDEWWAVSFTPWLPFPRGKCPQYTLSRRLGGPPGDLDVRELSLAVAGKRSAILRTGNLLPTPYTGCVIPVLLCWPAAPIMFTHSE